MSDKKEDKQYQFIEKKVIKITAIEVKTNPQDELKAEKVIFDTSKGDITWKPKTKTFTYQNCLKISKIDSMQIEELPDKLIDMAKKIQQFGSVDVKVCYTIMTVVDGPETKHYRFITSEKQFNEWILIPSDISFNKPIDSTEEKVE